MGIDGTQEIHAVDSKGNVYKMVKIDDLKTTEDERLKAYEELIGRLENIEKLNVKDYYDLLGYAKLLIKSDDINAKYVANCKMLDIIGNLVFDVNINKADAEKILDCIKVFEE